MSASAFPQKFVGTYLPNKTSLEMASSAEQRLLERHAATLHPTGEERLGPAFPPKYDKEYHAPRVLDHNATTLLTQPFTLQTGLDDTRAFALQDGVGHAAGADLKFCRSSGEIGEGKTVAYLRAKAREPTSVESDPRPPHIRAMFWGTDEGTFERSRVPKSKIVAQTFWSKSVKMGAPQANPVHGH
eukprot:gene7530-7446_t